jgi:ribonucleoside-diphosphate reductase alpha chain
MSLTSLSPHTNGSRPFPTVSKRDGSTAAFDAERIRVAIEKAFRAELDLSADIALAPETAVKVAVLATGVVVWCREQGEVRVEQIQDEVERALMRAEEHGVARRYILYREARAEERRARVLRYTRADGTEAELDHDALRQRIVDACIGLDGDAHAFVAPVFAEAIGSVYNGIGEAEITQAIILAARSRIERDPAYTYVAARLLLAALYAESFGTPTTLANATAAYREYLPRYIATGIAAEMLDPTFATYDLERIAAALRPERDLAFAYLGLQTLYDRYVLQTQGRRFEPPQLFWMRVAMGLAHNEDDREGRAIAFYDLISQFAFTPSSPTLFNAGTRHPQLSSCFLTTVPDDLGAIFKCMRDNALLSKWSGGLGNDWTNVRALGAHIKGTNGSSQGIIPFLKVANDTAIAVNQGGKRKGAVCAYLEPWHLDVEEFLDLRKNTGDDRRRTHDMNTAFWVPDLLMKRVLAGGDWTLFSPNDVPDLHDSYGAAFEARYLAYEAKAQSGAIVLSRTLPAVDLWRRMLTMLFETGHPWITFKDPSNVRSPQDHAGVVHSSNLCTEILLNTTADETAVCNLGSINLPAHLTDGRLNLERLQTTVRTAVRMLDNVIDLTYYPTDEARAANMRHRPVGLGIMGFQDALYALGVGYASQEAVEFADRSMEAVAYYATLASAELARERGPYGSYAGSKWDRGLLPIDTIDLLEASRGLPVEMDRSTTMEWEIVRAAIRAHGMRNSNVMAIAPTATISNIVGTSQSIEPAYKNLYVKSNMSGDFTQINIALVDDLKRVGLWDDAMLDDLKYYDGSLVEIERIPEAIKERYLTAFEVAPEWLIAAASRRQKWIDMGQSLNLYMVQPSGKKLSEMYLAAWRSGLKTTYYLRTLAATQVEKSTLDINRRSIQPRWMKSQSASSNIQVTRPATEVDENTACNLGEDCEACQ